MTGPLVTVSIPVRATNDEDVVWLHGALRSLQAQTFKDWEAVVVNDHSTTSLDGIRELIDKEDRIRAVRTKSPGVSETRNTGVAEGTAPLVFALDHDDLLPQTALEHLVVAWEAGGKDCGIVYGDVELRTQDARRQEHVPQYSFPLLLQSLFMPVGSLHSRASWKKAGGWDADMDQGLEDWEYWIRLGTLDICGYKVDELTYIYRRHPGSRLSTLRENPTQYASAMAKIRAKFAEYYSGEKQVMCVGCGGYKPRANRPVIPTQAVMAATGARTGLVQVLYTGARSGGFYVKSPMTGTQYYIPGARQLVQRRDSPSPGVLPEDVQYLSSLNRGNDFRMVS